MIQTNEDQVSPTPTPPNSISASACVMVDAKDKRFSDKTGLIRTPFSFWGQYHKVSWSWYGVRGRGGAHLILIVLNHLRFHFDFTSISLPSHFSLSQSMTLSWLYARLPAIGIQWMKQHCTKFNALRSVTFGLCVWWRAWQFALCCAWWCAPWCALCCAWWPDNIAPHSTDLVFKRQSRSTNKQFIQHSTVPNISVQYSIVLARRCRSS